VPPSAPPPPDSPVEGAFQAVYGAGSGRVASSDDGLLRGIAAYRGDRHWHLVTLGLAAIDPPRREGATSSGPLGHELSLIVPAAPSPPPWAFGLLDGAARTAVAVGRPFHAGARMAPGPPVDGAGSGLVAIAMREDPVVVATDVPLLQAVGVTQGEYLLMQRVGTALVLERLAARDRLLTTDPARA
jgi:hypothetical protein